MELNQIINNKPSARPFAIGNNPGWYGNHYKDEELYDLMWRAGMRSTRSVISINVWNIYGMETFAERLKYPYKIGMRNNTLVLTTDAYLGEYADQDTTMYGNKRTIAPKGLFEPIYLKNGSINPRNRFAVYTDEVIRTVGDGYDYFEVMNEPDLTDNVSEADDPNRYTHPLSWNNREPGPTELMNIVAPIKHYVRMHEIAYTVIKKLKPSAKIATGGLGFPYFFKWCLKYGIEKWVDVLSLHFYPYFEVHEWSNQLNGFIRFRHSDGHLDAIKRRLDRWRKLWKDEKLAEKPMICTEVNVPEWEFPDLFNYGSEVMQRNFTAKLFPKMLQWGFDCTYLFVCGQTLKPGQQAGNAFGAMGLYRSLNDPNIKGKEQLTPQGKLCIYLQTLFDGFVFDEEGTRNLSTPKDADGIVMKKGKESMLVLWAITKKDRSEEARAIYKFKTPFKGRLYELDGHMEEISASEIQLTGEPIILKASL